MNEGKTSTRCAAFFQASVNAKDTKDTANGRGAYSSALPCVGARGCVLGCVGSMRIRPCLMQPSLFPALIAAHPKMSFKYSGYGTSNENRNAGEASKIAG